MKSRQQERDFAWPYLSKSVKVVETRGSGVAVDAAVIHVGHQVTPSLVARLELDGGEVEVECEGRGRVVEDEVRASAGGHRLGGT